jgi:hypothetical protein
MKIKGQTKAEFQKNYTRVQDIMTKSKGDKALETNLAQRQANAITDEHKAINRAMAAKEIGNEEIFEVFFRRAYQLGSVDGEKHSNLSKSAVKKEYRDYVIAKLFENE